MSTLFYKSFIYDNLNHKSTQNRPHNKENLKLSKHSSENICQFSGNNLCKLIYINLLEWRTEVQLKHSNTLNTLSKTTFKRKKKPGTTNDRSSHWRCSIKKMSLKISQNSQQNTCARVLFVIKLQADANLAHLQTEC